MPLKPAIAEGDGSCFVQKKRVDVASRFDGASRPREDVMLNHPVHSGDADGRQ